MRKIVLLLSMLLCACATKYDKPPGERPHATLNISPNHAGVTTSNLFVVCKEDVCDQSKGGDWLAVFNWANPNKKTVYVAAQEKVRIKAYATNNLTGVSTVGGRSATTGTQCINEFSFIPESGHAYNLHQELTATHCRIRLTDAQSGQTLE